MDLRYRIYSMKYDSLHTKGRWVPAFEDGAYMIYIYIYIYEEYSKILYRHTI